MAKAEDSTENVTAEEVKRPISSGKLKEVLKARRQAREDRKSINDNLAAKVGEVVGDKLYLDRVMFPVVEKLFNMKDERLAYHYDNLMHMLDISGINDRAAKVGRLPITNEQPKNVTAFPKQTSVAAE